MGAPRDTFKYHYKRGTKSFTPESPMTSTAARASISGTSIPQAISPRSDAVPPVMVPKLGRMNSGERESQPASEPQVRALSPV